ncbi:MAG: WecB/TagA/CpsF family glycosyltransferase [Candidatus Komeilibacteria bacterium]
MEILGIRIDNVNCRQTTAKIFEYLAGDKQCHIATVNPEFIVDSYSNHKFKAILNKCDLNTADGFGIKLIGWFRGQNIKRCCGSDLVIRLAKEVNIENYKVYLLGGREGVAYTAANKLRQMNPKVNIVGTGAGFNDIKETTLLEYNQIIDTINRHQPEILLVGYNAPYAQYFIDEWLDKMPSIRVAIAVGGSFDFIAGKIRRAPKILRYLGLEWVWRLILQPSRWHRIYQAVFKFLYLVIKYDRSI